VETRFSGNADQASRKGLWRWMIHGLPWNAVDCSVPWAQGTRIGGPDSTGVRGGQE
jgi:hypothetical protein